MKVERLEIVEVVLTLSEKEAKLLKTLFQNPLYEEEPREVSDFRRLLWERLTSAGVNL